MTQSKELFLKNKDLRDKLSAIVHEDWFKTCLAYAKADMLDNGNLNADQISGASRLENSLFNICEPENAIADMPSPKMNHDPLKAAQALKASKEKDHNPTKK